MRSRQERTGDRIRLLRPKTTILKKYELNSINIIDYLILN